MPIIGFGGGFGGGGGGASYINGVVPTSADLPITVGNPAMDSVYLAKVGSGVWLINRKPAGLYCRTANNGVAADWTYLGAFPEVNADGNWELYNTSDPTKELKFDLSGITTGTTRTLTAPNESGIIQLALVVSSQFVTGNTLLSAGRNRRITLSAVSQTVNVDLPYSGNADGDVVTLVASSGLFASSTLSIRKATGMSGGLPVTYVTLATLTAPNQSFTFVSDGTATGWTLRSVDTHTHAASDITSGVFDNARINFAAPPAIGNTTPSTGVFTTLSAAPTSGSALTLTGGTVTASAPLIDATQTWNNAAVTFTGLLVNVTNTASAAASWPVDFQVGGSSQFRVRRSGGGVDIAGAASGVRITDYAITGLGGGMQINAASGGTGFLFDSGTINTVGCSVFEQRTGTTAQTFRIYNTFTNASNYERGFMRWSSNVLQIGTEALGTGSTRVLEFYRGGLRAAFIDSGGFFNADQGFLTSGQIRLGATQPFYWSGRAVLLSPATDQITILNSSQTDFGRLNFGGTTSSFPALKRSSTALQVRLADDSAFAPFACAGLTLNGDLTASTRNIVTDTTTGTKIGTGTTQLLGFWNATPVAQQSSTGTNATGYTANGPTNTVHADSTFTGNVGATAYSISDIVKHLKTIGLIAS